MIKFNKVEKKIADSSGVSIVFALFGMLIAVLVSTVLVNAALTNAERASRTRLQNQEALMADSAAKMLRRMMEAYEVNFTCTETRTVERKASEGTVEPEEEESEWTEAELESDSSADAILTVIRNGVDACLESGSFSDEDSASEFTVGVDAGDGEKEVSSVKCRLLQNYSMDMSGQPDVGDAVFDLSVQLEMPMSEYGNTLTITAQGRCEETGSVITESSFHQILDSDNKPTGIEERTDIIKHTYTVSWKNVLITKGLDHDS